MMDKSGMVIRILSYRKPGSDGVRLDFSLKACQGVTFIGTDNGTDKRSLPEGAYQFGCHWQLARAKFHSLCEELLQELMKS